MRGQRGAVLQYFKENGSLTSMEAFEKFGATRLAAIVFDLRCKGHIIETHDMAGKNRYGETCIFAKYVYKGMEEE